MYLQHLLLYLTEKRSLRVTLSVEGVDETLRTTVEKLPFSEFRVFKMISKKNLQIILYYFMVVYICLKKQKLFVTHS